MMYVPGAKHRDADAVSRHPTGDPETVELIDDVASITPTHICDTLNLPTFTHINDCNTARDDTPDDNALESTLYSSAVSSVSILQCVTWDKVRTAASSDDNMLQLGDKKVVFTVTCPPKKWVGRSRFFFFFFYPMYMFGCHYASKARFYSHN